jgi:hypothetical protein
MRSFRIRELQPCRRIAGRGPCCQIWRKQRRRIPSGTSQWLGKPLRSDRPWSSGALSSHHEKEYHSVTSCSASSPRMVGHTYKARMPLSWRLAPRRYGRVPRRSTTANSDGPRLLLALARPCPRRRCFRGLPRYPRQLRHHTGGGPWQRRQRVSTDSFCVFSFLGGVWRPVAGVAGPGACLPALRVLV